MNNYLSGIMALSQLTPEQFDFGRQRYETLRNMFSGANQAPSLGQPANNMGTAPPSPASQPAITQTQSVEGGFGTGPTPYSQPYYRSSFASRNPYFGGYGMGYQPQPYMPMMGRVGFNPMGSMGYGAFGGGKGGGMGPGQPYMGSSGGGKGGAA